jgi:regulator of replication initiation timing
VFRKLKIKALKCKLRAVVAEKEASVDQNKALKRENEVLKSKLSRKEVTVLQFQQALAADTAADMAAVSQIDDA